ncbi:MAG: ABC-2 family transporter protein [Microlunatus sp.]
MRSIQRHLLVWWQAMMQAIRRDLQFRSQTIATVVTRTAELGLALVPVLVVASVAGSTSGWTAPLALVVSGAYGISAAVLDCFVGPNCARMDRYVRHGELDLLLMRPIRTGFLSAVRWIAPSELTSILPSAGILAVGLLMADVHPDAADIALAIGWAAVGTTAFAFLWLNLSYSAFWMDGSEPVNFVVLSVRTAGQYPQSYFPRPVRAVLATVVPAGLLAAVPVDALLGEGSPSLLAVAALGLVVLGGLTALHWSIALRHYSSAST